MIGVFVATGNYLNRGIAGRWKAAFDDLGDQYDPRVSNTIINFERLENTEMRMITVNDGVLGGLWTNRVDISDAVETKKGDVIIGGY